MAIWYQGRMWLLTFVLHMTKVFTAENCERLQRTHIQRPLLRMSPSAGDETSRGRNPENRRRRDFGRRTVSASLCSEHNYSDHSWGCLPQPGTKRRGEGILRMEDAETSEEVLSLRASAANTPTATTPEDVSLSRGWNVEGKESWEWKTPGLQKKKKTPKVMIPVYL